MNERGVEALVAAGMSGRRQIKGAVRDDFGGVCALGVLYDACGITHVEALRNAFGMTTYGSMDCPLCHRHQSTWGEVGMVSHLNDDHGLDFIGIARKLGPDAA